MSQWPLRRPSPTGTQQPSLLPTHPLPVSGRRPPHSSAPRCVSEQTRRRGLADAATPWVKPQI
eukprot:3662074-Prorocentrum_lima.AAC.1